MFNCYFCFYFIFTVYTNVLNNVVFMVTKRKKKQFKSQPLLPPAITTSSFFQPQLLVFDIFSNYVYYSTPLSIRDLILGMFLLHVWKPVLPRLLKLSVFSNHFPPTIPIIPTLIFFPTTSNISHPCLLDAWE